MHTQNITTAAAQLHTIHFSQSVSWRIKVTANQKNIHRKWSKGTGRWEEVILVYAKNIQRSLGNSVMYFHFDFSLSLSLSCSRLPRSLAHYPFVVCVCFLMSFYTHKHIIDEWKNDSDVLCALCLVCVYVCVCDLSSSSCTLHRKVFFFYFAIRIGGYLLKPFNMCTFFLSLPFVSRIESRVKKKTHNLTSPLSLLSMLSRSINTCIHYSLIFMLTLDRHTFWLRFHYSHKK